MQNINDKRDDFHHLFYIFIENDIDFLNFICYTIIVLERFFALFILCNSLM